MRRHENLSVLRSPIGQTWYDPLKRYRIPDEDKDLEVCTLCRYYVDARSTCQAPKCKTGADPSVRWFPKSGNSFIIRTVNNLQLVWGKLLRAELL